MSDTNTERHVAEDGSTYAVEVVTPEMEEYGQHYRVDLVRSSMTNHGLVREQRLQLGEHTSWGAAEEHQHEIETLLKKAELGDEIQRLGNMPYLDGQYMALVFPVNNFTENRAKVHLLYLNGLQLTTALVGQGRTEDMEAMCDRIDRAWTLGGNNSLLQSAQKEAELSGQIAPGTLLFEVIPDNPPTKLPFTLGEAMQPFDAKGFGCPHYVDGGGTAHWFAIVESPGMEAQPSTSPYELRYFQAEKTSNGNMMHSSYPVMPLADKDTGSAWPLPGLEMYLQKGDLYMAQQFAHDIAEHYGKDFPDPLNLPALNPRPDYYFGYGVGPNNEPSLEAVKTWMNGSERLFDTLTVAEYCMWDEAQNDEQELEALLKTQGLEGALNQAERLAAENGYLDPHRTDPRIFFKDNAPLDPFTTVRERTMEREIQYRDLQQGAEYRIDAISANGISRLDVMKSWGETEYEREILLIPQSSWEIAQANAEAAHDMLQSNNLQGAMTLVELAGIEAEVIDPQRTDPRLFAMGPTDPFTTIREREKSQELHVTEAELGPYPPAKIDVKGQDYLTMYRNFAAEAAHQREANAALEGSAWFEATFENSEKELLQPLHDTVNYGLIVQDADPWTLELAVEKYWKEPNGYLGAASLTINTYSSDDENGREQAEQAHAALLNVYNERGLEAMMHKAELSAVENKWLDGNRADARLFAQGPPDRFETLAQRLEGEINPYWNISGENVEDAGQQPEVETPYWRLDPIRVSDSKGELLGYALHMIVYPGMEREPDAVDIPTLPKDEPFKMLEMAHFETTEAIDKFSKEFKGYLVPGLLEGPELAVEVARLEGFPAEWKKLEGDDLKAYQNTELVLTHDPSDWHPYNPNAERDARIIAEGLYNDTIQRITTFNEDITRIEVISPNLDL